MLAVQYLALSFGASELGLALFKRARRAGASARDAGTLPLVWLVILAAGALAYAVARGAAFGHYEHGPLLEGVALALVAAGIALRWWAILVLGRFFTVDVAIHPEHQLVRRGPYALLRHPSYTGALMVIGGVGILFDSAPALLCLLLPISAVLLLRIQVEERALAEHFGAAWREHCARTKRFVPWVW
jgi:protein-S-isoprenylcysteine O-methyltransferase